MARQPPIHLQTLVSLRTKVLDELATQEDTKDRLFGDALREYLENILGSRSDRTVEERLQLLLFVLRFFKTKKPQSIQACIDALKATSLFDIFSSPGDTDDERTKEINFSIMRTLGLWLGMRPYFEDRSRFVPILLGYKPNPAGALNVHLPKLISRNRLVPSRSDARMALQSLQTTPMTSEQIDELLSSLEAPGFAKEALNAYTLTYFTKATIGWTENICEHLSFTENAGQTILRVFSRPSILLSSRPYGMDDQLAIEVGMTYAILFNPYDDPDAHSHSRGFFNKLFYRAKWCECFPCASKRMTTKLLGSLQTSHGMSKPHDPAMQHMIMKAPQHWDPSAFEYLWPRVLKMNQFQRDSRPWNFWVLLRDRRDTVKFWTFLFAAIVIPLTLLQLLVSIIQAVAAFPPAKNL